MGSDADLHLVFGLVALQNGLINQDQLLGAFRAWSLDKARPMADHLVGRGDLDADDRSAVEALVARHLKKHGGDAGKSLAAFPAGRSTRESLAAIGDPEIEHTLTQLASSFDSDIDSTASYAVGSATSDGLRFRVLRPHARGGLGAVFVALDTELHREVALKQILEAHADEPTSRQRFLVEAEVTGGLEHPGIVPVYGLGTYGDGRPYYAMRFIRGDSLKEAIAAFHADAALAREPGRRSLELRKLLRRFLDVCNAIEYAHGRGVLHRDLKPGNIIVGRHGETLVVDWGLAKASGRADPDAAAVERPLTPSSASGSAETLPGSAIGTPSYMSPEQARGDLESLGPASDVYSLGATLYCLLTGHPPFEGPDVGAVLRAVARGDVRSPRQVVSTVDRALEAICLKAMATKPEDRYPRARALAEDIERWMADEPVSAWREPISRRAARFARRHRPLMAGAAMLLVSAVVALSVGAVLINRERAKAEVNFRQARAAVDEYFTTVSESKLLNVPGLQPLRKELLNAAQRYYRDFLRERGGDPSVRVDAAAAMFRFGWINMCFGREAEALEPLRTATAMYEELARTRPGDVGYRRLLATGYSAQGLVLPSLDRREEGMSAHRKALAIREALARNAPGDVLVENDVVRTHRNIGILYREAGKPAEALAEFEKASAIGQALLARPLPKGDGRVDLTGRSDPSAIIREDLASLLLDRAAVRREAGQLDDAQTLWERARALFEVLVREKPEYLHLQSRLADVCHEGATLHVEAGRFQQALPLYRRALEIAERLAASNPSIAYYRATVADCQLNVGWVLRTLGRIPEALNALATSVEIAEALVAEEPGSAGRSGLLARSLQQSGNLLLHAGRTSEAIQQLRRALEIQDAIAMAQPKLIGNFTVLTNCLRGVGRAEAAAGRSREAHVAFERASEIDLSLAEKYPACRYNLACDLALLIPIAPPDRREDLASRAVDALRRARAEGYGNLALAKADHDLDALRARPDFRDLLLDMAFPANPIVRRD